MRRNKERKHHRNRTGKNKQINRLLNVIPAHLRFCPQLIITNIDFKSAFDFKIINLFIRQGWGWVLRRHDHTDEHTYKHIYVYLLVFWDSFCLTPTWCLTIQCVWRTPDIRHPSSKTAHPDKPSLRSMDVINQTQQFSYLSIHLHQDEWSFWWNVSR